MVSARQFVSPPMFEPSPYGLFSVAEMRTDPDVHWKMGVQWQDYCGTDGDVTFDECTTSSPYASGTPDAKSDNGGLTWFGATPYTVYAEVDCSPIDFYERADKIAAEALARTEQFQVERALWTGRVDNTASMILPHLGAIGDIMDGMVKLQMATAIVTGTTVDIRTGLGALEQNLASGCKGVGVIHAAPELAPVMADANLIIRDGQRYRTHNGNLVAFGNGYPGINSIGTGSGDLEVSVMYATGPVFVYRGAPTLRMMENNAGFDRSVNSVKAIAERTYVHGFGCCLYTIAINTRVSGDVYNAAYYDYSYYE